MRARTSAWLFAMLLTLPPACADDATRPEPEPVPEPIRVHRVPSAYPTIQAAIDAAIDGDTVLVASGTYQGNGNRDLRIEGKTVTLLSEKGPDSTIIDCDGSYFERHRAMLLLRSGSLVRGFTIRDSFSPTAEGALSLFGGTPAIEDCVLEQNVAEHGAAVALTGVVSLRGCWIRDNYAYNGAAVMVLCGTVTIDSCLIEGNRAEYGGSIETQGQVVVNIEGCTIRNNVGPEGAVLAAPTSAVELRDTLIANNAGSDVGGITALRASVRIENCTITRNVGLSAGGVYVGQRSSVQIVDSILRDNCSSEERDMQVRGSANVSCSAVDTTGLSGASLVLGDTLIFEDPGFCEVAPCGSDATASYGLLASSPCLPGGNVCGRRIGAQGLCGTESTP